jgi:hypothetical protein
MRSEDLSFGKAWFFYPEDIRREMHSSSTAQKRESYPQTVAEGLKDGVFVN